MGGGGGGGDQTSWERDPHEQQRCCPRGDFPWLYCSMGVVQSLGSMKHDL